MADTSETSEGRGLSAGRPSLPRHATPRTATKASAAPTSNDDRVRRRLCTSAVHELEQLGLGRETDMLSCALAILEHHDGGNATNAEFTGRDRRVVHVELAD